MRKPTRVEVTRLDDGRVRVKWNAPIRLSMNDFMILGYRKNNNLLLDSKGRCVGFEAHQNEYIDICAEKFHFSKKGLERESKDGQTNAAQEA